MTSIQGQQLDRFEGALPLLRKFQDHPFWKEKRKFSRAEAWIDLLYRARYSELDEEILDRGEVLAIKYGQILTSMLTLAKDWTRSRSWVKKFVTYLNEKNSIKIIQMNNRRLIIEIANMGRVKRTLQEYGRQKLQQNITQKSNGTTYKNKGNKENKVNITYDVEKTINSEAQSLVEKITKWAFGRSRVSPSCTEEAFRQSVYKAIIKVGMKPVFKAFEYEDNAIEFLMNIKTL